MFVFVDNSLYSFKGWKVKAKTLKNITNKQGLLEQMKKRM
jgi:hypothetical protein